MNTQTITMKKKTSNIHNIITYATNYITYGNTNQISANKISLLFVLCYCDHLVNSAGMTFTNPREFNMNTKVQFDAKFFILFLLLIKWITIVILKLVKVVFLIYEIQINILTKPDPEN